jgi:glycosyltransferase involved in cell wall biosynthesis
VKVIHPFRTGAAGYGLERNILCTLPGLVEQGVETVALVVTEPRSGAPSDQFIERLRRRGVRVVRVETRRRLPVGLARRMSAVFAKERPEVIHSHDYKCDLAMLWSRTGRAARMTTVHGWCSRAAKERFYEWVQVQCCKRMDAVVVFCEDYRRRLTGRGVPRRLVRVAPVGLDPRVIPREDVDLRSRWGVGPEHVLVAQLGRLSREKRPDLFVELATRLSDRYPAARFVLVGDGELRDALERQIEDFGKGDVIRLAGYVLGMGDVLGAIDVAVNCSTTEAIPRTILEAGWAGVPVVATAVGGVPDAVETGVTGLLCPPGDAEALAGAVARLIEDPDLRQAMGAAARERVGTVFSIDACSQRLVELYETLPERKEAST